MSDNSDDERDYDGNRWDCTYCDRTFKSQGEVLFHEKTWCVYEYERKQERLKDSKTIKKEENFS